MMEVRSAVIQLGKQYYDSIKENLRKALGIPSKPSNNPIAEEEYYINLIIKAKPDLPEVQKYNALKYIHLTKEHMQYIHNDLENFWGCVWNNLNRILENAENALSSLEKTLIERGKELQEKYKIKLEKPLYLDYIYIVQCKEPNNEDIIKYNEEHEQYNKSYHELLEKCKNSIYEMLQNHNTLNKDYKNIKDCIEQAKNGNIKIDKKILENLRNMSAAENNAENFYKNHYIYILYLCLCYHPTNQTDYMFMTLQEKQSILEEIKTNIFENYLYLNCVKEQFVNINSHHIKSIVTTVESMEAKVSNLESK